MTEQLTVEKLRSVLAYEPDTGVFRWRIRTSRNVKQGEIAGCYKGHRYHRIRIEYRSYRAHRLAWLYVHGEWPANSLDHINGDTFDNRIANLRPASYQMNGANARRYKTNRSGFKGVSKNPRSKGWSARIGKGIYLGSFDTAEDAHAAYIAAARELYGEFARAA